MKDLEKIFYGNIVAYDAAMLPEAKQDELQNVIWKYGFYPSIGFSLNDIFCFWLSRTVTWIGLLILCNFPCPFNVDVLILLIQVIRCILYLAIIILPQLDFL